MIARKNTPSGSKNTTTRRNSSPASTKRNQPVQRPRQNPASGQATRAVSSQRQNVTRAAVPSNRGQRPTGQKPPSSYGGRANATTRSTNQNNVVNMPQRQKAVENKSPFASLTSGIAKAAGTLGQTVMNSPMGQAIANSPVGQAIANSPVGQAFAGAGGAGTQTPSRAKAAPSVSQTKSSPADKPKEEKKGLFGRIGDGIGNLGKAAKEKLTETVGNVLEKGKGGVKALIGKGAEIAENAKEALGTMVENGKDGVKNLIGKGAGVFEGTKELLGNVLEKGKDGVKSLFDKGAQAAEGMKELFGNVLEKGKDGVKSLVEKGGQAVEGVKEFLGNALEKGKDGVKSLIEKGGQAVEGVKEMFGSVLNKGKDGLKSLISKGAKVAEGAKELFGAAFGKVKEAGKGFLGDAKDTFFETLGNIKDTAVGAWDDIATAYDENWGEASKIKQPGEKERTGFDKFLDFTGKVVGTGATLTDRFTTDLLAGGTKLLTQGIGRGVGMFSEEWGDKINSAGDILSGGLRTAGNMVADFKRDIVHGAIGGDSVKDPGVGHILGQTLIGFVPVAGQIADVRDVIGGIAAKDAGRTFMAGLGILPGLGDGLKQLKHADELPGILKYGSKFMDGAKGLFNKLPDGVQAIGRGAGDLINGAKKGAGDIWGKAKGGLSTATDWLGKKASGLTEWLGIGGKKAAGEAVENADDMVTYRRVQGGGDSKDILKVNEDGTLSVNGELPKKKFYVSTGTDHANYFKDLRGEGSYIVEADLPKYYDDLVKENAIPQFKYTKNKLNQGGMAPEMADRSVFRKNNLEGEAFGLPRPMSEWFVEYAQNARIVDKAENLASAGKKGIVNTVVDGAKGIWNKVPDGAKNFVGKGMDTARRFIKAMRGTKDEKEEYEGN